MYECCPCFCTDSRTSRHFCYITRLRFRTFLIFLNTFLIHCSPINAARELQRLESQTRWITNYWRSYMSFKVSRAKRPSRCGPSEQLTGTGVAISKQQQEGFKLAPAAFALEKVWEKLSLQRPINNNNIWTPPLTLSQGWQSRNQLLKSSTW